MKKAAGFALISIAILFIGLMCGMFLGRNCFQESLENVPFQKTIWQTEAFPPETQAEENEVHEWRININTALTEELDLLPGIGPALAQRIVAYRQEHGAFTDISQLTKIQGIGEATVEKLKDYVILEDEA